MLSATTCASNQSLHKGSNFLPCCSQNEVRGSREPAALFPCLPMHSSQTRVPNTLWGYICYGTVFPLPLRCHLLPPAASLRGCPAVLQKVPQPPCLMLHLRRTMSSHNGYTRDITELKKASHPYTLYTCFFPALFQDTTRPFAYVREDFAGGFCEQIWDVRYIFSMGTHQADGHPSRMLSPTRLRPAVEGHLLFTVRLWRTPRTPPASLCLPRLASHPQTGSCFHANTAYILTTSTRRLPQLLTRLFLLLFYFSRYSAQHNQVFLYKL